MLQIKLGNKLIKTDRNAFVMGIVNATPDSFFSNSRGGLDLALKLIDEGADILDIGGESTRPGFTPVSADEEINRVIPLIREIRKHSDIPISVDTYKLPVFKAAFQEGADVWNDVNALSNNDESARFVADNIISVILMHNGEGNIDKVISDLNSIIKFCKKNNIADDKIILDPGIGFGKSNEECINIISNINKLCNQSYPVLMALSRKRCIGHMTGKQTDERLVGTLAANMYSVQNGSKIIRVHDVSESIDMLNVMKNLQ